MSCNSYQEIFVQYVTSFYEEKSEYYLKNLLPKLNPKTRHRAAVYQNSFRGRAISSLSELMFEPLMNLFGKNVVKEIVARYFCVYPPDNSSMVYALHQLPQFVLEGREGWIHTFFADLCQLCIKYQEFLVAEDSNKACYFHGISAASFYKAWLTSSPFEGSLEENYKTEFAENILFLKLKPNIIHPIFVHHTLHQLLIHFVKLSSFSKALQAMSDDDIESICEEELNRLFLEVQQTGLFLEES